MVAGGHVTQFLSQTFERGEVPLPSCKASDRPYNPGKIEGYILLLSSFLLQ